MTTSMAMVRQEERWEELERRLGEKWRDGGEDVEDVNAFGAAAVSEGADTSQEWWKILCINIDVATKSTCYLNPFLFKQIRNLNILVFMRIK